MTKAMEASFDFALKVIRHVGQENQDSFMSPFSLSTSMAMVHDGSEGDTRLQLNQSIFGCLTDPEFDNYMKKLSEKVGKSNETVRLDSANRMYCQSDFEILQSFKDRLHKSYQTDILSADFRTNVEKVRQEVNTYVADRTHKKVLNLVPEGAISPDSRLVLVNALYFKAEWEKKFNKPASLKKPFYRNAEETVEVPLMRETAFYDYGEDDDCQVMAIPFKTTTAKMLVFLPKRKFGLKDLEMNLTGPTMLKLIRSMKSTYVHLEIPKMKVEQSSCLNDTLKVLGVVDAFDQSKANFSRLTHQNGLAISQVVHKAFIEVDEDGAEAAAATGVFFVMELGARSPSPPKQFVADRPFMFAIVSSEDHVVYFLGHFYASSV